MIGKPLTKELNSEQQRAVEFGDGALLVLAGAGSGKTRVLTYRYARLVREMRIHSSAILAVTFTNKAAKEMRERIQGVIGDPIQTSWIGTFHSICARMIRMAAPRLGFDSRFTIFDGDDQKSLLKTICRDHALDPTPERLSRLRTYIGRVKSGMEEPSGEGPAHEEAIRIYHAYQKTLRRMNAFDFDDLLAYPLEMFRKDESLLDEFAGRFEHVLVDEYQDTNGVQNELVRLLSSRCRNICAVGDDDQSIYRWRGADIANILHFEDSFPGAEVIRLEQNYRSTKPILDAAAAVIKNNSGRRGKRLWTERKGGDLLTRHHFRSERDEGHGLARDIQRRMDGGRSPSDFAIFYRTNAQSRSIEDGLRLHAIPYMLVGGTRFYERKEVKDCLAYLRLLVNGRDDVALGRVLNVPARGVGNRSRERLATLAGSRGIPLLQAAGAPDLVDAVGTRAARPIGALYDLLLRYARRAENEPPHDLVHDLIDEIRLLAHYEDKEGEKGVLRAENVKELVSAVAEFERRKPASRLADFLEEVSLLTDIDSWDDRNAAVTLMTLHNSKGLEFTHVYISGLEEGLLPHARSVGDDGEIEEERRLLYVGITRAKDRLTLSSASSRIRYGEFVPSVPSRFLEEIPPELVDDLTPRNTRTERHSHPLIHEELDSFPDYENESQEIQAEPEVARFRKGDLVKHGSWGAGRVTAVEGKGLQTKISVTFQAGFQKKIMVRYARLEHFPRSGKSGY